jgi:hypothetical protein
VATKPQHALDAEKISVPHLQPERACFMSAVLRFGFGSGSLRSRLAWAGIRFRVPPNEDNKG